MPRKKQAESAKTRRQKLLDYFHSHPRQPRFISDVKDDLNIKNEQNLRRDLELLAEGGTLEKTKDTSKLPARTVYTLIEGASRHLQAQADEDQQEVVVPQTTGKVGRPSGKTNAKQTAEKPTPAAAEEKSVAGDVKGRRSARELEQRILSLLEQQPTTVKELADHLKRQQPTVTKALERMQERRLVERKRLGRSFVYSQLSRGSSAAVAAPAAVAAAVTAPVAAAAAPVVSQPTETSSHSGGNTLDLQSIIETAIRTGITVALEHIGRSR